MSPIFEFLKKQALAPFSLPLRSRIIILTLLICLFLIFEYSRQTSWIQSYGLRLKEAQQLRSFTDFEGAQKILKNLQDSHPEDPAAYIESSMIYEEMGDLSKALEQNQKALKKTNRALWLGSVFLNRFRLMEWRSYLKQREKDLPLSVRGQEAVRLWNEELREESLALFAQLNSDYPEAYEPHAALAFLYKAAGEYEKSLKEAESANDKITGLLQTSKIAQGRKKQLGEDREKLELFIQEIKTLYEE